MVKDEAIRMIEDVSESDHLTGQEDISSIASDSLEFIFLTQSIERQSGVTIPNQRLVRFTTVGDMAGWIAEHSA